MSNKRVISNRGVHGDVNLRRVEGVDLSKMTRLTTNILAYGEVTGHMHALGVTHQNVQEIRDTGKLDEMGIQLYRDSNGTTYAVLEKEVPLSHQEHLTSYVQPGTYQISITREYDPMLQSIQAVRD